MRIVIIILSVIIALSLAGWLGLHVRPTPFPAFHARTPSQIDTLPLPGGLPAPVERYYHTLYGERVPRIETVVMTGRGVIRPVMNIPLPSRFIFVHVAGQAYRHYFESTFFNLPFLKVNEGIFDGKSFFESPMGSYHDDPNSNQGANLALFAEASWFPSILVTDARIHWAPVDDNTALLYVPFEDTEENFVVRFNPRTGLIDMLEAMRYRSPGDQQKMLWIPQVVEGENLPGTQIGATGAAMWLDQGKPWATFTIEDIVYNVDVSQYVRQRGY